jgi:dTDP-4-amino-4,6-dideoxygalactose transaminase
MTPALLGGRPAFETKLDIVRPVLPGVEALQGRLAAAMRTGQVTNMGVHSRELEARLAAYVGTKHCAVFCNGEAALIAMLQAARLPRGAEVVTTAYTFSGTAHAIVWNGLVPVFADIDPGTWTLDPADAERRITPRTAAILAAPLYGNPCDNEALAEVARRNKVRLFFDSASGCGSRYAGRPLGGFGAAEMFSFHATKVFLTMEGGAICTDDASLYEAACMIRNFGKNGREADCDYVGFNGKMTEICALVGLELLPGLDDVATHRNRVAERYRDRLAGLPGLRHQAVYPKATSSWLYYQFLVEEDAFGLTRDELISALTAENVAARRFLFPCNHQLSCYRCLGAPPSLPVAEYVAGHSVALPVYSDMTMDEVDGVAAAVVAIRQERDAVRRALRSGGVRAS